MTLKTESVTQPVLVSHNYNSLICEAEAEGLLYIWRQLVPQNELRGNLGYTIRPWLIKPKMVEECVPCNFSSGRSAALQLPVGKGTWVGQQTRSWNLLACSEAKLEHHTTVNIDHIFQEYNNSVNFTSILCSIYSFIRWELKLFNIKTQRNTVTC